MSEHGVEREKEGGKRTYHYYYYYCCHRVLYLEAWYIIYSTR